MSFSRKKPSSQSGGSYNNNNGGSRGGKPRFQGGGQSNNRPRKNYGAMREKYLMQARDALAAGDRVLAENYFQHADHCFRMIAEEQASRPQRYHHHDRNQNRQDTSAGDEDKNEKDISGDGANDSGDSGDVDSGSGVDVDDMPHASSLPAFLTAGYEAPKKEGRDTKSQGNWEED